MQKRKQKGFQGPEIEDDFREAQGSRFKYELTEIETQDLHKLKPKQKEIHEEGKAGTQLLVFDSCWERDSPFSLMM